MTQTTHQPTVSIGRTTNDQATVGAGCVGRRVGDTGLVHFDKGLNAEECIDAEECIRQGLEDAKSGKLRPVREFFAEFEAKHGISCD